MIIELHAIQSFGPSNLNRDDTGNPKEALFGGVRRARISSQSAKRAIRSSEIFRQALGTETGTRTKAVIAELKRRLLECGLSEEDAQNAASHVVSLVFAKADGKNANKTSILLYLSSTELDLLTSYINEAHQQGQLPDDEKLRKELKSRLKERSLAPDIALFGRMLAEHPDLSVDAACQVAHALSTHEVNTAEFDYFTAVDDLSPNEESGAGMLGLVAYNSATYYRCVRIDWEQLLVNLHGDHTLARNTIVGFMRAFALVVPSAKQNSFVNQHSPDFLLAVLRRDNDGQSLDNAFEQPIRARAGSGYVEPSIEALATYWEQVDRAFRLSEPILSVMNPRAYALPSEELQQAIQGNLSDWVGSILMQLPQGDS